MRGVGNLIEESAIISENCSINRCGIGSETRICEYVNMYDAIVGDRCMVAPFVEIQASVTIGNDTRISTHSFICSNVTIGNNCYIAHGVNFTNDLFKDGQVHFDKKDWTDTVVEDDVKIGSGSTILPVRIGRGSVIGAGSVVTKDIPQYAVAYGNPAKVKYFLNESKK